MKIISNCVFTISDRAFYLPAYTANLDVGGFAMLRTNKSNIALKIIGYYLSSKFLMRFNWISDIRIRNDKIFLFHARIVSQSAKILQPQAEWGDMPLLGWWKK